MAEQPTLGARLKTIREARGLSIEEAARLTGTSTSLLRYVEAAELVLSAKMLLRITNAYGIDPDELLALRDQEERERIAKALRGPENQARIEDTYGVDPHEFLKRPRRSDPDEPT